MNNKHIWAKQIWYFVIWNHIIYETKNDSLPDLCENFRISNKLNDWWFCLVGQRIVNDLYTLLIQKYISG